jgi:hypothetical protein
MPYIIPTWNHPSQLKDVDKDEAEHLWNLEELPHTLVNIRS